MPRPRKTDLDTLIALYATMNPLDRALVRASIQGAEAVLSLHESKTTTVSETVQHAFAELGARVATEGE